MTARCRMKPWDLLKPEEDALCCATVLLLLLLIRLDFGGLWSVMCQSKLKKIEEIKLNK